MHKAKAGKLHLILQLLQKKVQRLKGVSLQFFR